TDVRAGPCEHAPGSVPGYEPAFVSEPSAAEVLALLGVTDAVALRPAALGDGRAVGPLPPLVALAMLRFGLHEVLESAPSAVRSRTLCAGKRILLRSYAAEFKRSAGSKRSEGSARGRTAGCHERAPRGDLQQVDRARVALMALRIHSTGVEPVH